MATIKLKNLKLNLIIKIGLLIIAYTEQIPLKMYLNFKQIQ